MTGVQTCALPILDDAVDVIDTALSMEGPVLVEVILQCETCVNPKLVVNRPIEDMSPFIDREELAEAMVIDLAKDIK